MLSKFRNSEIQKFHLLIWWLCSLKSTWGRKWNSNDKKLRQSRDIWRVAQRLRGNILSCEQLNNQFDKWMRCEHILWNTRSPCRATWNVPLARWGRVDQNLLIWGPFKIQCYQKWARSLVSGALIQRLCLFFWGNRISRAVRHQR